MASVGGSAKVSQGWFERLSGGDPLFGNKIAGGILGTCLFAMALNIGSGILYTPKKPAVPGYELAEPAPEESGGAAGGAQEKAEPLPALLASANAEKGKAAAKKCTTCHNFEKGGANKVGPDLYGVVERPKGSHEGFNYSAGMKAKGGNWTYEDINHFITNPKAYVQGTIMAFAGVPSPKERADILAYLQTLSDKPVPFPKPEEAPAGDKKSEGGDKPTPAGDTKSGAAAPSQPAQAPDKPAPAAQQANPQPADPKTQTQPGTRNTPAPTKPEEGAGATPPGATPATPDPATPAEPPKQQ